MTTARRNRKTLKQRFFKETRTMSSVESVHCIQNLDRELVERFESLQQHANLPVHQLCRSTRGRSRSSLALCEWIAEHLRISAVDDYSESRTLSSRLVHPPPQGDSIGSVEISGEPRFRASRGSDDTSAEKGSCCGITTEK